MLVGISRHDHDSNRVPLETEVANSACGASGKDNSASQPQNC